ncbi:MAG: NAD-binding protein [Anaerolineae bacterium]|nr:NAD-binding protein [Anaerolineae bacterium]
MKRRSSLQRRWRAMWRDTLLLLRDFRAPLLWFTLLIIGGGGLYAYLADLANESVPTLGKAFYLALTMVFFQATDDFPQTWYLQLFYFVMPLLGLSILAQGLADFGILLFNRRQRSKEWEMAVASTFDRHVIVVGLGHLGYRVVQHLHAWGHDVVVLELAPRSDLVANLRDLDIPIIQGDALTTLEAANIRRARAIVLCTQNDNLNMQIAVKARHLNKDIHVVIRIFDEEFARALQQQFGFTALSATGMAAPVFAATAAEMDVSYPIKIEGEAFSLARLRIAPHSKLHGLSVSQIEQQYDVSVVLLHTAQGRDFHPAGERRVSVNDTLAVLGGHDQINRLAQANQ